MQAARYATVAVIIPIFNQARFLADAIMSVLAQTRPADEIIVVDDGSTDDPAAVIAQLQKVRLIRQDNRGVSAARNTGLRSCTTSHVVFLDADDRLLPTALDAGLACIAERPDSAFVYGGYRLISENGHPVGPSYVVPVDGDARLAFLRRNLIGMPAIVLHRRDCLLEVNGFDETLRRVEDHDIYLRITERYPVASHPEIVAEYRKHSQNMSNDHVAQLKAALRVLDRHEARIGHDALTRAALRDGRANKRSYYVSQMLAAASARWHSHREIGIVVRDLLHAARWSPFFTIRALLGALGRRASQALPRAIVRWMERIRGLPYPIPLGSVDFGDLRRLSPISRGFGVGRGTPVDRYYIERFLAQNAGDIRGRTLEIADNDYTVRFGGERVTRSDVLHAVPGNPKATLVGDLATGAGIPSSAFDCIVLTQTLLFIYELRETVAQIRNALRPGGVALISIPGISQISRYDADRWGDYWRFTDASARRLFGDVFGAESVTVVTYGNVLAACAFLHGVAVQELREAELDHHDGDYQVIIGIRAVRSMEYTDA
jgi:glycosyltransferase involved in cell wall biosynthesis/SAM-dependent methyltransferase